jgi:hypothetical protein
MTTVASIAPVLDRAGAGTGADTSFGVHVERSFRIACKRIFR